MLRPFWPWFLILALPAAAVAGVGTIPASHARDAEIAKRERMLWRTPNRASEFSSIAHTARGRCEDTQPPQALATPNPLIPAGAGARVRVSFIIGADGRVHSPLILESAGYAGDRSVLQTVRHWRYRPATCNGVPTETEGKIEFSQR